jgi:hypothetical protein
MSGAQAHVSRSAGLGLVFPGFAILGYSDTVPMHSDLLVQLARLVGWNGSAAAF